jgi:hypothetical protein
MVGILIILVMILGMHIKDAPVKLPPDQQMIAATEELKTAQATEQAVTADVFRAAQETAETEVALQQRAGERNVLATMVSAGEQQIAQRRQQLDTQTRGQFDLLQSIRDAQTQLNHLYEIKAAAEVDASAPTQVESYPTPLSRAVVGEEVHFQLRNQRIVYVPMAELVEKFKEDLASHSYHLADEDELSHTVGPVEGFSMRWTARHKERVRLVFELIPESPRPMGETIGEALATPNSQFRLRLDGRKPGQTTVTIWVYPDSFAQFRHIKKGLFEMGFATAGRPLPENQFITGSNDGTRSSAE